MKNVGKGAKTYILLAVILLLAVAIMIVNRVASKSGAVAEVSVDGEVIKELPLSKDCEFKIEGIGGENILIIQSGKCYMEDADCPDKLCVKQGRIDKSGQSIICLPHRVVVTIKGDKSEEIDSTSK